MPARKFIRDMIGFAASQYMARLLLTVRGLVAARLLGPAGYGDWNALMLIPDHGTHAPLGTYQGLDQTVPARIVAGDARRFDGLKRAGLFNIVVSTALFVTLCMVYFVRSQGQMREAWGLEGVAVALTCVALITYSFYHLTLLRSHGNFTLGQRLVRPPEHDRRGAGADAHPTDGRLGTPVGLARRDAGRDPDGVLERSGRGAAAAGAVPRFTGARDPAHAARRDLLRALSQIGESIPRERRPAGGEP